ncbi:MAG TPA: glycosyltransferase family 87 protein [Sphingomicrobium sp.]|nr:glycosyltransferase family 87 protein [Sphingomicrobium sp.]
MRLPTSLRGIGNSPGDDASHFRALFVAAVLFTTALLSAHYLFLGGRTRWPIDFQVFWTAGGRPLHEVYEASQMPFVYPPTALFLFKPFSLLPFLPGYFVWTAISAILFGFAVAKTCGTKVAALSFLSPAANRGIMWGQSAMLLGGALFASLRLPPFAMGAVFGLVAAVKPQLVMLAPLAFLIRSDWRSLAGMATGGIVAVLASLIAFGPTLWLDWIRALPQFQDVLLRDKVLSMAISPAGRAEHLGLPVLPVLLASAAVGLTAVVALAKQVEGEMLIGLIVAASIAASPYAHIHDMLALIPACLVLLHRGNWPMAISAAFIIAGTAAWAPVALLAGLLIAAIWCRKRKQ